MPEPAELPHRGGRQRIPRPPGARTGGPPPWSGLGGDDLDPGVDRITAVLADAEPALAHPVEGTGVRASAVLVPLYADDGRAHLVFTRRAQHLRTHRGEVSFPGGGEEPGDADLAATALRESREEIALDPAAVEIVGELDHLTTITSRSFIVPYVGLLPGRPDLEPSPAEVEKILYVPVADLLDPDIFRMEHWGLPGLKRPIYFFEIPGDTIWGATAAMLVNLLALSTGTTVR